MTPDKWTINASNCFERPLGDSEYSYYPPSRDGVGDMFLHIAFRAPKDRLRPERVVNAWAVLRNRHPLLACQVIEENGSVRFSFLPPGTVQESLKEAQDALFFRRESKDDLISGYMNGPRTLSNAHLSYLVISGQESEPSTVDNASSEEVDYDLLMCAPHFAGDGTSLHQSTHDLFVLLASPLTDEEILASIDLSTPWTIRLPPAFESRCKVPRSRFAKAVAKVNALAAREKEVGGHKFTRHQRSPQKTIFLERVFNETQTKAILRKCKENGVTINHALEVLCGVVWSRVIDTSNHFNKDAFKDPVLLYTAINVRPHLEPSASQDPTYWFLALTHFTLTFPSFPLSSPRVFWHRAKTAKAQTHAVVHSSLFIHTVLDKANERGARVRNEPVPVPDVRSLFNNTSNVKGNLLPGPAPSIALLGLSLIGNLDAIYDRRSYPKFLLKDVTTASRQKAGGILLLVHTFGGKLWLQLFYDQEGFGSEGIVERFWDGLGNGVEEFMLS